MTRDEMKQEVRNAIVRHAPDMAVSVAEQVINAPRVQAWFDRIERRRPRGLVALVRRLRGKKRGLSPEERATIERLVRDGINERS